MATDDLLARIRTELEQRMAQLRPLLSEYERLIAAADTLATIDVEDVSPEVASAPPPTPETRPAPPRRRTRGPRGSAAGAIKAASTPALEGLEPNDATETHEESTTPAPSASTPSASAKTRRRATPAPAVAPATPPPVAAPPHEQASLELFDDEDEEERERPPVAPAEAQQAILAALEHGSHTVSELVMVTAMSASDIRSNLSRLTRQNKITKVKRAGDGKTAHALPSDALSSTSA